MSAVRALICLAALMLLATPHASAHEERSLDSLTVLDSIEPPIDGIDFKVVHLGGPALVIDNRTPATVVVMGINDEPFLKIGPRGVQANVTSPTTYHSSEPGGGKVPSALKPDASPRWATYSKEPLWSWFDPRLVPPQPGGEWQIPMRVDGAEVIAAGSFEPLHAHGHFIAELDDPGVDGLEVELVQGPVPGLFVRNGTTQTLMVAGLDDEPFLRIGPTGVFANLLSPSYYLSGAGGVVRRVPPSADAGAAPRWKKVSSEPLWGWLERRATVTPEMQLRSELGTTRHSILSWESPMSLGGRSIEAGGRIVWVPAEIVGPGLKESNSPPWRPLTTAAVALLVGGGIFVLVRRQGASSA